MKLATAGVFLWWSWCCACSKHQSATETSPSAAASVQALPPPPPPASVSSSHGMPAAAGQWNGTYEARPYRIEMSKKEGAVREWSADQGASHTGKGTLTVDIAEDGSASGSAKGPLGELAVTGEVDDSLLRLRFTPVDPGLAPAFTGMLVAKREGDAFTGRLQASSGDSLIVREASVSLRKK